jgi:hypothetical protein
MSNLMPEIDREWPAHLEPIRGDYGPVPKHYALSRSSDPSSRQKDEPPPAPRAKWRKSLMRRKPRGVA